MTTSSLALLVEDQAEARDWLLRMLASALPSVTPHAVGDLAGARAWLGALEGGARARLRLALVDLGLPDGSGVELIRLLRREFPGALPVVVTAFDDDDNLFAALAAGAEGYLLKHDDPALMAARLRRIDEGEPPLTPTVARRVLAHFQKGRAPAPEHDAESALTPREAEVLRLIGRGSRVAEAAAHLGLTEQTVATYVKIIYRKLRISSRAEAALAAARRGLV